LAHDWGTFSQSPDHRQLASAPQAGIIGAKLHFSGKYFENRRSEALDKLLIGWVCAALVAGFSVNAKAQTQLTTVGTGTGKNLNVDHYQAVSHATGMLTVSDSNAQQLKEWSLGLYFNYSRQPLVLYAERLRIGNVISDRTSGEAVASIGLLRWLEVGFAIPFTALQRGEAGLPTGELTASGLHDPRIHAKIELLSANKTGGFGIALLPEITIPLGDDQAFLGAGGVTAHPQLIVDGRSSWLWGVRIAAMAGARYRPAVEIGNLELSHELSYRLGAGLGLPQIGDNKPELFAELYGVTPLSEPWADTARTPLIASLGIKNAMELSPGHQMLTTMGTAFGLNRGYGAPEYQAMIGVAYRRWLSDRDGDGIYDDDDFCPDDPEDKDGFEDADGCPDPDNDKDGIPDVSDRCPSFPEDFDQFQDLDGCPDPDNDRDRILDKDDKCPNVAEDFDGIADEDGCPEDDHDIDGIPDEQDRCPYEKETINGVDDDDGCPDEGKSHINVTSKSIRIDQKIFFELASARIEPDSFSILNQVALTLKANPQIRKMRVEGHADERGSDDYNLLLTQERAESVMEYLIGRGVKRARLEAVGYGEMKPLLQESNEGAWELNRRVEFTIVGSGPPPTQGGRSIQIPE
jgi:outer membrane protein OmpA-like peptidoglycan-associated protein